MSKDVIVLGIHDGHDAGAALIKNGHVVAAIQEERIVNKKKYCGVPFNSISKVFTIANIDPSDVDVVAIVGLLRSQDPLNPSFQENLYKRFAWAFKSHGVNDLLVSFLKKRRNNVDLLNALSSTGIIKAEIVFIEHHLAHAACAFYQRPWDDETLILTLDGAGDGLCSTVSIGRGNGIERIASTTAYNSPGNILYSEITGFFGLKRWEHEYKIMGLAPYGLSEYCLDQIRKVVDVDPKKPLEFINLIGSYYPPIIQKKMREMLKEQRFDNICAATQEHYEQIVIKWVSNAVKHTGIHKIVCAGGNFLNVKANKLIRELDEVEQVFFYPSAGDEGTPVGAAMEGYHRFCEKEGIKPSKEILGPIYYGMEYDNDQIKKAIDKCGWMSQASYYGDIDGTVGELLAKGKIIARFNGRVEWGARALGNRSILADPRDLRAVRRLNYAIKQRDFWMPFAPAVLEKRMDDYFINAKFAPYMIEAFDTKPLADEILAGLHPKDNTGRPQSVNYWNPGYQKIIESFEEITGVGGLVNTSFNIHGYPIVGDPETALNTLKSTDLSGLAIGNFLVMKG